MADFSSNDINDAKRRVEEMRNRARQFVDSPRDNQSGSNTDDNADNTVHPGASGQKNSSPSGGMFGGLGDIFSKISGSDDSSLILALVLILSREKADNMLILALLYILL